MKVKDSGFDISYKTYILNKYLKTNIIVCTTGAGYYDAKEGMISPIKEDRRHYILCVGVDKFIDPRDMIKECRYVYFGGRQEASSLKQKTFRTYKEFKETMEDLRSYINQGDENERTA